MFLYINSKKIFWKAQSISYADAVADILDLIENPGDSKVENSK